MLGLFIRIKLNFFIVVENPQKTPFSTTWVFQVSISLGGLGEWAGLVHFPLLGEYCSPRLHSSRFLGQQHCDTIYIYSSACIHLDFHLDSSDSFTQIYLNFIGNSKWFVIQHILTLLCAFLQISLTAASDLSSNTY